MLFPLLALLVGATALGIIVAVVRDSGRKGYPAGYRRGRPLPRQPVRRMTSRPPSRPVLPQLPRGADRPAPPQPARGMPPLNPPVSAQSAGPRPWPAPAPLEESAPAARLPAEAGRPPPTPTIRPGWRPAPASREPAPAISASAGAVLARGRVWTAAAFTRTRGAIDAMATSPRTRKAAATSREYARRTADALVEQSRRLSAYTRDQFGRDPRRAWMVTAAVGAALLVLLFVFIASTSGDDQTAGPGEPSAAATTSPIAAGAESANSAPNTATGAATPSPASAGQSLPGTPFSETAVTSALQSRGLNAILVSEPFTCQNASTTPKTYRVTAAGAEQRFVLLVYPNAAGMNGDWVIGAGRPQYRNGDCAAGAAVIYFNQNVLLVFPQTTSAAAQAQIADAFLTLP